MKDNFTWREKLSAVIDVIKFKPFLITFIVLTGFGIAALEALGLGFIQPIFEIASSESENLDTGRVTSVFKTAYNFIGISFNLENLIIGVSVVMLIRYSASFIVGWQKTVLSKKYESNLKEKCFKASLKGKVNYWDDKGSDEIVNHIIGETSHSSKVINKSIEILEKILLITAYLVVMTYISSYLTIVTLLLLGGTTFMLRGVLEPAINIGNEVADANEKIQNVVHSGVYGIKEVKLFDMYDKLYSELEISLSDYTKNGIKIARNEMAMKNFYRATAAITIFVLIYVGIAQTELNFGKLGIFLLALYRLSGNVSNLNGKIYRLEGYIAHFLRTRKFLEDLSSSMEEEKGVELRKINNLSFEDVSFSYKEETALEDLNLNVEEGEFVGIAGHSGAGKSTVASLIGRFYNPESGSIKANRKNISDYSLKSWRNNIAIVQQQSYIFNTTLRENINLSNEDVDEEKILEVCKIAKVDEFLNDLPDRLDTVIGENGLKLSGGQRQRVAIARALLRDPDLLILDEATSDLDSNLENEVQKSIEENDKEYSIIAIAHRLSTLKNADKIYTMSEGSIEEHGTHEELLSKQGSYSNLYSLQ